MERAGVLDARRGRFARNHQNQTTYAWTTPPLALRTTRCSSNLGRIATPITGMPGGRTLQAQIVANFLKISALPLPIILVPVPDQVYSHMLLLQRCASETASGSSFSELFNSVILELKGPGQVLQGVCL